MRILVLLVGCIALWGQPPQIYYRSVVNAAHFLPPLMPQGAIARGSVISIFGVRMGPAVSPGLAFPLQPTLGGVAVKIVQGSTSVAAYPLYVSAGQVNAIIPSNAPLGAASITVTYQDRESPVAPVKIVGANFGIYTALGTGNGPGIIQNFVSQTDQPLNSPSNPIRPGGVVTMWGTGLGAVNFADNVAPTPGNVATRTEVFVGGKLASILYNGRSPCCAGSDQIVFTVPADAPTGCWVPVVVRTEGTNISNGVTMAISSSGSCSDPDNPLSAAVRDGLKLAGMRLIRVVQPVVGLTEAGGTTDVTVDGADFDFRQLQSRPFPYYPAASLPPTGTCAVTFGAGINAGRTPTLPIAKRLNAGSTFTVSAGTFSRTVAVSAARATAAQLGKILPGTTLPSTVILSPGPVTIRGPGGADAGALNVTGTMPQGIEWTNRAQLANIVRSQGATVNWTGSLAGQLVAIIGGAVDDVANGNVEFVCLAAGSSSSFTIPAPILQALPANGSTTRAFLQVGVMSLTPFNSSGFDAGVLNLSVVRKTPVTFQ